MARSSKGSVKKKPIWYIVASSSEAVFYKEDRRRRFSFVERLENPGAKLKESALDSDRAGRGFSTFRGGVLRHGLEGHSNRHDTLTKRFAKEVSQYLELAYQRGDFGDLTVVAEPTFLGVLREKLSSNVKNCVRHEIARLYPVGSDRAMKGLIKKALEQDKIKEKRAS